MFHYKHVFMTKYEYPYIVINIMFNSSKKANNSSILNFAKMCTIYQILNLPTSTYIGYYSNFKFLFRLDIYMYSKDFFQYYRNLLSD